MPLIKWKSKKVIWKNIKELQTDQIGPTRMKAIKTYAKKNGLTFDEARQKMSVAIAYAKAGKSKVVKNNAMAKVKSKKNSLYI